MKPVRGNPDGFIDANPAGLDLSRAGPIERAFWSHDGRIVGKWQPFLPAYDRHFAPWLGSSVRILELGVHKGGSLDLWRKTFGPNATIFGVDIDPACAAFDGLSGSVRIGSQDDPAFLSDVVDEMGGVDIVIDDGSHVQSHVRTSFSTLYPRLSDGGIYAVEDMGCAYWLQYGGQLRGRETFMTMAQELVDDMHHWYHEQPARHPAFQNRVGGVHFYDGLVIFDKADMGRPHWTWKGTESPA